MKILLISDTHDMHYLMEDPPEVDIAIHAGDFMNTGMHIEEVRSFRDWYLKHVKAQYKIVIAGNHDIFFDETHRGSSPLAAKKALYALTDNGTNGIIYLQDDWVAIDGIKIYGSPWTPAFMGWGFNLSPGAEAEHWKSLSDDIDILVTHGPPHGVLDQAIPGKHTFNRPDNYPREHLGCPHLRKRVAEIRPKIHVFGHIHGGRGTEIIGKTTYINASFVKENYRPHGPDAYYLVEL